MLVAVRTKKELKRTVIYVFNSEIRYNVPKIGEG